MPQWTVGLLDAAEVEANQLARLGIDASLQGLWKDLVDMETKATMLVN